MADTEPYDPQHAQIADLLIRLHDLPEQRWRPAATALGVLGSPALPALLQADDTADGILRRKIVFALGDIDDARARERLLRHVADPNREVRYAAAWVLGNYPHPMVCDALIPLLAEEDTDIWHAAVHSLRTLGAHATSPLLPCLHHATPHMRAAAIAALTDTRRPDVVQALEALLDDPSDRVVAAAIHAIAGPERDDLIPRLTAMLAVPAARIREGAADGLGLIGNRQAVDGLLPLLHDPDQYVVRSVVIALGRIGDEQAITPLLHMIVQADDHSHDSFMLKSNAGAALIQLASPVVVAPLLRVADRHTWVWFGMEIIRALHGVAVPELIAACADPEVAVRERAAKMLGEIGVPAAIPALLRALDDADDAVRWSVAFALGCIQADLALPNLLACLAHDPAPEVRTAAAGALGAIGNSAACDPLAKVIETAADPLRWAAVRALAKLRDPRAFALLSVATEEANESRRGEALSGLGDLGDPRGGTIALALLDDPSLMVRRCAIQSLGVLGEQRAVEPLISALADVDEVIRWAACTALGELRAPQALAPLQWVAEHDEGWIDPDPKYKVSNAALAAIARIQGVPIEPPA